MLHNDFGAKTIVSILPVGES
jgi:hypothetical protein